MQTAWKLDSYLKIMRFYVFKMTANGGCHFEINIKLKNYQTKLFLKSMHSHTHFTNVFIKQIIILWGYFMNFVHLLGIIGKKSISTVS